MLNSLRFLVKTSLFLAIGVGLSYGQTPQKADVKLLSAVPDRLKVEPALLTTADLTRISDDALFSRYRRTVVMEGRINNFMDQPAGDKAVRRYLVSQKHELSKQAIRIGEEMAKRNAAKVNAKWSHNRAFWAHEVQRMKQFFLANVEARKKTGTNLTCVNTFRRGVSFLYDRSGDVRKSKNSLVQYGLSVPPDNSIESLMARAQVCGMASPVRVVQCISPWGRKIDEGNWDKPVKLNENVWDVLMGMVNDDPRFSVFCLSLADGYHVATLTVDNRDRSNPKLYWADQTNNHNDGWEEYQRKDSGHPTKYSKNYVRGLNEYILYAIQEFWKRDDPRNRPTPIIRIWRLYNNPSRNNLYTELKG